MLTEKFHRFALHGRSRISSIIILKKGWMDVFELRCCRETLVLRFAEQINVIRHVTLFGLHALWFEATENELLFWTHFKNDSIPTITMAKNKCKLSRTGSHKQMSYAMFSGGPGQTAILKRFVTFKKLFTKLIKTIENKFFTCFIHRIIYFEKH